MGRFPWGNGHSKQSSDKLHAVAHDWFSKDGAEPSRQALTDLMKDHASTDSGHDGESPKGRGRSRTNTVTSSFSLYAPSTSDGSNDMTSRPPSQHSFVDSGLAFPERPESTAKALLSKSSRLLKRQGSKLSLLPSQMEDKPTEYAEWRGGETSPIKNLQRQLTLNTRCECRTVAPLYKAKLINSRFRDKAKYIWTVCISAPDSWRSSSLSESGLCE